MTRKNSYLSICILLLINIIGVFFILTYLIDSDIKMSFFITLILINLFIIKVLFLEKSNLISCSIVSFTFVFFFFTPIIQINLGHLPNTFPVIKEYIIKANILIHIFLITYLICYVIFSRKYKQFKILSVDYNKSVENTMYLISILIIIVYLILGRVSSEDSKAISLILSKFIYKIPVITAFYSIAYYKKTDKKYKFLSIILLIIFLNPNDIKRNELGPYYLAIIIFLYSQIRRKEISNAFIIMIFITIFLFVFPITKAFTHLDFTVKEFFLNKLYLNINIVNEWAGLDYDAYANILATLDYIKIYGISYGVQFLGVLLFFVPRSIWITKPLSTGMLIGNFLMINYGMWFNNLSNPLVSEAYINFGLIGVIISSIIIYFVGCKTKYKLNEFNTLIVCYLSLQLIFIQRGDLMNGWAYLCGPIVAIYILNIIYKIKSKKAYNFNKNSIRG